MLTQIPQVDILITMGGDVQCPYISCKYRENWNIDDPTENDDELFKNIIFEIEKKILVLKKRCNDL
jgi:arsenate reductase (thioredoxin)